LNFLDSYIEEAPGGGKNHAVKNRVDAAWRDFYSATSRWPAADPSPM
jgi:hypothetical protein